MAKVRRIRTIIHEADVDDGDGFNPHVALGIAKGAGVWALASDELVYHVEEDGATYQIAGGRPPALEEGPGGELVEAADSDSYGAGARERDAAGGEG